MAELKTKIQNVNIDIIYRLTIGFRNEIILAGLMLSVISVFGINRFLNVC